MEEELTETRATASKKNSRGLIRYPGYCYYDERGFVQGRKWFFQQQKIGFYLFQI